MWLLLCNLIRSNEQTLYGRIKIIDDVKRLFAYEFIHFTWSDFGWHFHLSFTLCSMLHRNLCSFIVWQLIWNEIYLILDTIWCLSVWTGPHWPHLHRIRLLCLCFLYRSGAHFKYHFSSELDVNLKFITQIIRKQIEELLHDFCCNVWTEIYRKIEWDGGRARERETPHDYIFRCNGCMYVSGLFLSSPPATRFWFLF